MSVSKEPPDDRVDNVVSLLELRGGQNHGYHRVLEKLQPGGGKPPHGSVANGLIILTHDPQITGLLGFDEFVLSQVIRRAPPVAEDGDKLIPGAYPRPWEDADVALILAYIQRTWCAKMTRAALADAMIAEASQRRFHPVKDWLRLLKWDGKERLNRWLLEVFAVPDDDYHKAVGSKLLIAAVRRVMRPGCKFDQLLVLEGNQGLGKSRACRVLFGDDWFSDSIHPDLSSRDAPISLRGKWGVELAEIQHLIRNEVEVIKAFLSRPIDTYRPVNGKAIIDVPRQSILIGTTNTNDYLRDVTGNRRIWPVRCADCRVTWLEQNRDQLWAEAVMREGSGEALWIDDHETKKTVENEQVDRMAEDSWTDPVVDYLAMRPEAKVSDILTTGLSIPRAQQGRAQEMRVAAVLRSIGWVPKSVRKGSSVVRLWHPPPETPK